MQSDLLAASKLAVAKLPDQHIQRVGQLKIYSDFEIASSHRLLNEMQHLRDEISQTLAVEPSQETIHVYLFAGTERFSDYCKTLDHPVSDRRAFFVQTDTTLSVFAAWSENVLIDLRHELTHAYVHSAVPRLPLWLDEGIAEYFEVNPGQAGVNVTHVEALRGKLPTSLGELEKLHDPATMKQMDYAASWLWVHFLLNHSEESRQLLRRHIRQWHERSEADRLSDQVDTFFNSPTQTASAYLQTL